jgi:hypothetical protein
LKKNIKNKLKGIKEEEEYEDDQDVDSDSLNGSFDSDDEADIDPGELSDS